MRQIVWAAAILFATAAAGWSQAYYEASGQTQIFTLAAGAKVGPAAIKGSPVLRAGMSSGISVVTMRGGMVVALPAMAQRGVADIALYDIKGRQLYHRFGFTGTLLRLETKAFAPGVYNMLVRVEGKIFSRAIALSSQGG
jgi:hypothetical protein